MRKKLWERSKRTRAKTKRENAGRESKLSPPAFFSFSRMQSIRLAASANLPVAVAVSPSITGALVEKVDGVSGGGVQGRFFCPVTPAYCTKMAIVASGEWVKGQCPLWGGGAKPPITPHAAEN